jgi:hypothetical protein
MAAEGWITNHSNDQGMHRFYEHLRIGWHVYPDGSVVRLDYVREGYAEQWARTYNMTGRKASAHRGTPEGHDAWWDGDND